MNGIFAANRAHGFVSLALAATPSGTGRTGTREEGSLRVRFPGACAGAPEAVLVNTAGGIAGGDHFAVDLDLDTGARLVVTTAAAEKVYRSLGPDARFDLTAKLADRAELVWLPQETILFDRARLSRTVDIALAPGASLVFAEAVIFGRAAMGETMTQRLSLRPLAHPPRRQARVCGKFPPRRRGGVAPRRDRRRQGRDRDCDRAARAGR